MKPTAPELLQQILELVPLGARPEGLAVDDAARLLETEPSQVLALLSILQRGMGALSAGAGDQIQGGIEGGDGEGGEGDRIRFFTPGAFGRPPRLLTPEALALALGMRILAGQVGEPEREALLERARRLERELATTKAVEYAAEHGGRFAVDAADGGDDAIRSVLMEGCRSVVPMRIRYLKPRDEQPEERVVEPHRMVHAEGAWYLLAWCRTAGAGRAFRVDRVMEVEEDGSPPVGPSELDPEGFVDLEGGKVYRPDGHQTVVVRYSPVVARWIEEREAAERLPDGSCRVTHRVADPLWVVRHVLQYGPDAWVESPPEIRTLVEDTVRRMVDGAREV